jgi:hypothetical protein
MLTMQRLLLPTLLGVVLAGIVFVLIQGTSSSVRMPVGLATPNPQPDHLPPATAPSTPALTPSGALTQSGPLPVTPDSLPGMVESPGAVARVFSAPSVPPADPDPSGLPPETVMENVRSTFRAYAARFRGHPVGTNPEITAALNGANPSQAVLVKSEDGLRINSSGELVDSWGTPFFFHQLSGTEMEIHSAGPDRVLWTADDLVVK